MEEQGTDRSYCQTYITEGTAFPSYGEILQAQDPVELEKMYREVGLTQSADQKAQLYRLAAAARYCPEIPDVDMAALRQYFPQECDAAKYAAPTEAMLPSADVVAALRDARKSGYFDGYDILFNHGTPEAMLVATSTVNGVKHYYKLAQWSQNKAPVLVDKLRQQQRRKSLLTLNGQWKLVLGSGLAGQSFFWFMAYLGMPWSGVVLFQAILTILFAGLNYVEPLERKACLTLNLLLTVNAIATVLYIVESV